jgi:predicted transcriptional regulator
MQNSHSTIADAARELGVSAKTIRQYIAKKIIPDPPVIQFGNRKVKHFSRSYLTAAKKQLQKYRTGRDSKG